MWLYKLAYRYPGIRCFYCRYKDDDLKSLREVWNLVAGRFPPNFHARWNPKDESWDFPNGEWHGDIWTGSRVYLSSLRVSEAVTAEAVHGKYKGKTLAVVVIEEAQEVPRINYYGLKERLSQFETPLGERREYPLKIVLVHNSIDEGHWIDTEFPLSPDGDSCTREGHAHIRADLYSNARNLGPAVMAGYEADYPPGHILRRAVIEGRRGPTQVGKPVYGNVFDRHTHVSELVRYHPAYPVLEGWDFGEEKPCVSWWQWLTHLGALRLLGAVKGNEVFLETFAARVLQIRGRLFPGLPDTEFVTWCDPTGATGNQGMQHTAHRHLVGLGVSARFTPTSNQAHVRYAAIQVIAGYLERVAKDGSPAFQMVPAITELQWEGGFLAERPSELHIAAFQTGYVWDERASPEGLPNVRKPKKGTRYDDLMNTGEYVIIGEQITVPTHAEMWSADRKVAAAAERIAQAAVRAVQRPGAVGPTGETLEEAMARIRRQVKQMPPEPDAVRRAGTGRGRGGW